MNRPDGSPVSPGELGARLRFSIIGQLLAAPPAAGELRARLEELSSRDWKDPVSGQLRRFALSTIERWYYEARGERTNPFLALSRSPRKDAGSFKAVSEPVAAALRLQYTAHKDWTYLLHHDNLLALGRSQPELGELPSYATLRRYMRAHGMFRKKRRRRHLQTEGELRAAERLEAREVRSYEAEYAHALWHSDFHHGSRPVLTPAGHWAKAYLLGILDDHSRVLLHAQWYLEETAECFVHGLMQAFQKRGVPRELMTDNGSPMQAAETCRGLERLGVLQSFTLPYSPYQNGKQECFWGQIEGRLMPMLDGEPELTLDLLNEATQAWVELEYNQKLHSELGTSPLARLLAARSVGRECPASLELRRAFRAEYLRRQRKSDGTISLGAQRYEVPSRYRHLERLRVAAASWDKGSLDLLDARDGQFLCSLYPLDKQANANRARCPRQPLEGTDDDAVAVSAPGACGVAPLLVELMAEYRRPGLPPAYLPKYPDAHQPDNCAPHNSTNEVAVHDDENPEA